MLFLHFWNVSATLIISPKGPVSQICVVSFSNLGNWITFGPLRLRCLLYIWTTFLITVHTFAVVILSLHIRKYAMLLQPAWLQTKKLGFTLFSLCSHKGWTANSSSSRLSTPGVSKLLPVGQIRPTKPFQPAREAISSGHKDILPTIKKMQIWFCRMQHMSIVPKQSHYVRCPALELLYNSLCGPRKKKRLETLVYSLRLRCTVLWTVQLHNDSSMI